MIEVVGYDADWPARFEALRHELSAVLGCAGVPVLAIEHVGSTSVPGLSGKPVVDCDVVVVPDHVAPASDALVAVGFQPLGDLGIDQRWAFAEPARLAGTSTYVVVEGCLALRNHVGVREVLRTSPELRERYSALKEHLGASSADIEDYNRGKDAVLQEILAAAGLTEVERQSIDSSQSRWRGDAAR